MPIRSIRKRDGVIEPFRPPKITAAIHKALFDAGLGDGKKAERLCKQAVRLLEERFSRRTPSVEDAQDAVEKVLASWNLKARHAYAEFRRKKAELRKMRKILGVKEKLSYNAAAVLERRYLLRDKRGRIIETPAQMFKRVARTVAAAEPKAQRKQAEQKFYNMMSRLEFLPNSPTLMNAGAQLGQLSACFVLPVEDSLESIFSAIEQAALIEQSGGGVGFSFSRLRPAGDLVRSTMGVASGPVSFMRVFDMATEVVKQGGKRRGAMMAVLRVDHPDILDFISAKSREGFLTNFNLSVAVTEKFMKAARRGQDYGLINPRTGKTAARLNAAFVWNKIIENAWRTGDPGVIFIDRVNALNPTKQVGVIEATNPCGEQPLHPYESCNLGSINLAKFVRNGKVEWNRLADVVRTAVRFLDDVIDVNKYPLPQIEEATKANRRIGLGVMGFADMLILLGVPYASEQAVTTAEKVMKFISREARAASERLGRERGSFPNFKGSLWEKRGYKSMRNATTTTVAPTGTISIIAGCSSGIEPLFAVSFVRRVLEGRRLLEANALFEKIAKKRGFYSADLLVDIARRGCVRGVRGVPADVRRLFGTALEIRPEWHVRMQAAFQKYTDNAVSKTINLPRDAAVDNVRRAYELAYKLGCKGITVYRYGSKKQQVLYVGREKLVSAESEYAGGCPTPLCPAPG